MRIAHCLCWALEISLLHMVSLWRNDGWLCTFHSIHKNVIIAASLHRTSFSSSCFSCFQASKCRQNDRFNMSDTQTYCVSDMTYSNWKVSLSASVVALHGRKIDSCRLTRTKMAAPTDRIFSSSSFRAQTSAREVYPGIYFSLQHVRKGHWATHCRHRLGNIYASTVTENYK